MNTRDLEYTHPAEAVAQHPAPRREDARLLVVPRNGAFIDSFIRELADGVAVRPGDLFVMNDSRVRPARLVGTKDPGPGRGGVAAIGGRVEILLVEFRPPGTWLAMLRASRSPAAGARITCAGATLQVTGREGDLFVLEVVAIGGETGAGDLHDILAREGVPPLPPYIRREAEPEDLVRYQTTHARAERDAGTLGSPGSSIAAPTAGLHFTAELRQRMAAAGASFASVSLGVGPGTFRPIDTERVEDHRMHEEPLEVSVDAADAVNRALAEGRRVTAIGTTSLRALEAASLPSGRVRALRGRTGLFLLPGARLRVADRLLTNFHQPRSTLLALVAAFAGPGRALEACREGVARGYRLFSYGDAMLIERAT